MLVIDQSFWITRALGVRDERPLQRDESVSTAEWKVPPRSALVQTAAAAAAQPPSRFQVIINVRTRNRATDGKSKAQIAEGASFIMKILVC